VSEKTTSASADELRTIISNGKHHMPKYAGKLTPDEIDPPGPGNQSLQIRAAVEAPKK
jgi:hypothetical protein